MTSVELKLLACATQLHPDARHLEQTCRLLPQLNDMDAFITLTMNEGLAGLFYKTLLKSGLFNYLENSQKQKLQAHYHQTARLNLLRIHELKKVLQQIAQTDIQIVLLKGIALIQELYQNVGLRPMCDVDLWVLAQNLKKFSDILIGIGYEQDPLYPRTYRKDLTTLDLRTHILDADRIKSRALLIEKEQNHIFYNARIVSVDGQKALVLDPYDQILYLGLHAFKHNIEKMIWLVDIRALTAQWAPIDWHKLFSRAKEMKQEKTFDYMMFLLGELLEYHPLEAGIFQKPGCRLNLFEKKILTLRKKNGALPDWAPLLFFSGQISLKKRIRVILETLFPRPEILQQGFRKSSGTKTWQLYLMRFFQLAGRMIRSIIK